MATINELGMGLLLEKNQKKKKEKYNRKNKEIMLKINKK